MKRARAPGNELQYIAKVIALENRSRDESYAFMESELKRARSDLNEAVERLHDEGIHIVDCDECDNPCINSYYCSGCHNTRWCRYCFPEFKREYQVAGKSSYFCDECDELNCHVCWKRLVNGKCTKCESE